MSNIWQQLVASAENHPIVLILRTDWLELLGETGSFSIIDYFLEPASKMMHLFLINAPLLWYVLLPSICQL